MTFSLGSVRDIVYSGISPFPSAVSGVLASLVNNAAFFVENFTGDTIGTTNINDKYQPALTDLATANVLRLMAVQDLGVSSVTVGDTSTNNNNLMEMADRFEKMGLIKLKSLSKGIKIFKARG